MTTKMNVAKNRRVMWLFEILLILIGICIMIPSTISINISEKSRLYDRNQMTEQFCTGETFRPRCVGGRNDVIVILSARYGRMNFGRCVEEEPELEAIKHNPRFIGCSTDVKHILDQQCSGLTECDLRILNQHFEGVKPCIVGLQMYLEASYACIQVAAESRHCTVPLTTEPQHIVSGARPRQVQTDTVGCGTESQPWSIEALSGQRIAVSLIDFGKTAHSTDDSLRRPGCHSLYGFIVDKSSRSNITVCSRAEKFLDGGQNVDEDRSVQTNIYTSRSNQLNILLQQGLAEKFIVRVEAVGCSDLAPPSDSAWLKRVDDQITVGCYMSRQSWKLNCVNGVWTGTVGVCSDIDNDRSESKDVEETQKSRNPKDKQSSLTEVTALVAVGSAGVAMCFMVICIGVVCLSRQQRQLKKSCNSGHSLETAVYFQENKLTNATERFIQTAS